MPFHIAHAMSAGLWEISVREILHNGSPRLRSTSVPVTTMHVPGSKMHSASVGNHDSSPKFTAEKAWMVNMSAGSRGQCVVASKAAASTKDADLDNHQSR